MKDYKCETEKKRPRNRLLEHRQWLAYHNGKGINNSSKLTRKKSGPIGLHIRPILSQFYDRQRKFVTFIIFHSNEI